MKVFVLGHTGMLGNAVVKYFLKNGEEVELLPKNIRWPSAAMEDHLTSSDAKWIINCIGAIPQKGPSQQQLFELNTRLPLFLFTLQSKMILHAATDCEFAGKISPEAFYGEDDHLDATDLYGISKAIPAEFIRSSGANHVKVIRSSIIGIEEENGSSLLGWFLSSANNGNAITGYTNHYWNGITTLEWAKLAYAIINNEYDEKFLQPATEKISKYQLLRLMADVFKPGYEIVEVEHPQYHNKCLASKMPIRKIEILLQELKAFYNL